MGIDNGSYGRDHCIAFIGNNETLVLLEEVGKSLKKKEVK